MLSDNLKTIIMRQRLFLAALCLLPILLAACDLNTEQSAATATPASSPTTGASDGTTSQPGKRIETEGGSFTNLTPPELRAMLDHKDFFLVDVHVPHQGTLPNTDARVPFDQVEQNIASFPSDKGAKIVVTCLTSAMSTDASKTLVRLGYTNVFNLEGGMAAWEREGYSLVPEPK